MPSQSRVAGAGGLAARTDRGRSGLAPRPGPSTQNAPPAASVAGEAGGISPAGRCQSNSFLFVTCEFKITFSSVWGERDIGERRYLIFLMDHTGKKTKLTGADAVEVFMFSKDLFKLCYRCIYVFKSRRVLCHSPTHSHFHTKHGKRLVRVLDIFSLCTCKKVSNRNRGFSVNECSSSPVFLRTSWVLFSPPFIICRTCASRCREARPQAHGPFCGQS